METLKGYFEKLIMKNSNEKGLGRQLCNVMICLSNSK
jgi:hypothetical protein